MVHKPFIFTAVYAATVSMAAACGFHTYAPQPTMVDRLLNSDHIVFARPDPENPFRFKVTEAFEGPMADVELPHLVDSAACRRFAADPDAQSLFARDGAYGPWLRIAYVGGEMKSVLDHVLPNLAEWGGLGDDRGRYEYFAGLIATGNRSIQSLALRELDQASYSVFDRRRLSVADLHLAARHK